jgi:hypothetical protein
VHRSQVDELHQRTVQQYTTAEADASERITGMVICHSYNGIMPEP